MLGNECFCPQTEKPISEVIAFDKFIIRQLPLWPGIEHAAGDVVTVLFKPGFDRKHILLVLGLQTLSVGIKLLEITPNPVPFNRHTRLLLDRDDPDVAELDWAAVIL